MTKIINKFFIFLKIVLAVATFGINLYIMLYMYYNLEKQPFGSDFMDFISSILPFVILLIFFAVNLAGRQKTVNGNIFYNITCCFVLVAILYMQYRALFDVNMVLKYKTDYGINFDYYADQLSQIKAMLYGLSAVNILLIIEHYLCRKKTLNVYD